MSLNDVFSCTLYGKYSDNADLVSTFHYVDDLGGSPFALADVLATFSTTVWDALQPAMSDTYVAKKIVVQMLVGSTPGAYLETLFAPATQGTNAGASVDAWTCAILKRFRFPRTRGNRGRVYLPCIRLDSVTTEGVLTPYAALTAAAAAVRASLTILGSGTLSPALVRASDLTWIVIQGSSVAAYPGVQRRRRVGFGS